MLKGPPHPRGNNFNITCYASAHVWCYATGTRPGIWKPNHECWISVSPTWSGSLDLAGDPRCWHSTRGCHPARDIWQGVWTPSVAWRASLVIYCPHRQPQIAVSLRPLEPFFWPNPCLFVLPRKQLLRLSRCSSLLVHSTSSFGQTFESLCLSLFLKASHSFVQSEAAPPTCSYVCACELRVARASSFHFPMSVCLSVTEVVPCTPGLELSLLSLLSRLCRAVWWERERRRETQRDAEGRRCVWSGIPPPNLRHRLRPFFAKFWWSKHVGCVTVWMHPSLFCPPRLWCSLSSSLSFKVQQQKVDVVNGLLLALSISSVYAFHASMAFCCVCLLLHPLIRCRRRLIKNLLPEPLTISLCLSIGCEIGHRNVSCQWIT